MSQKTILVVEDEFGTAEVLQLMLEVEGYRVMLAGDGREAQRRVADHMPDLVLTDFMMPGISGAQLGLALRAEARTAHLPIVMMSAADEAEVRRAFSGYDAFLHKPYRIDELLDVLRLQFERRPAPGPSPSAAPSRDEGASSLRVSIVGAFGGLFARPRSAA